MKKNIDVVVIGGGINGCCIAYNLVKRGIGVSLFEKDYLSSGATGACGAGIRQQWSTRENVKLAIESVKIFKKLSKELGEDIEFRQGGYLVAIHDKKELRQAEKNVEMQQSLGLDVNIVDPDKIKEIVPILDVEGMHAINATFCPSDGHANPFKTNFAYANAAKKLGANIHTHTEVIDVLKKGKQVIGVKIESGETIKTDVVVNAAGIWSRDISKLAGILLPNIPIRKEIIATERLKPIFEAMVISFRDGIYFSQQKEGQIVGGIPSPDQQSGFKLMPTVSFIQHMCKTLTRYAPVLGHVNIIRHWTGFYDVSPDARPILGEIKELKGLIQCNGFSGHGFMLSPMVSKILCEYIADGKSSEILHNLSLNRFEDKTIDRELSIVG
jgi:sarcosine oxidase subunit beta